MIPPATVEQAVTPHPPYPYHDAEIVVPREPSQLPHVRAMARRVLEDWGNDATLVLRELVTIAVRHAAGERVTIELRHTGDRVRTAVTDHDRCPKPPLAASPESGRGLRLVEARGRLGLPGHGSRCSRGQGGLD